MSTPNRRAMLERTDSTLSCSPKQAQRFLSAHAVVCSVFGLQRHLSSAAFFRFRRARAFERWNDAAAA